MAHFVFQKTPLTIIRIGFAIIIIFFCSCNRSKTIHPERKDIVEAVYASGKIISTDEYNVYALSNGVIKEKLVKEGDTVEKDQVLFVVSNETQTARLNASKSAASNARENSSEHSPVINELKLAVQTAQTKFQNDSTNYARLKNLFDQNIGTKTTLDNAYTNYTISFNQKKSAEANFLSKRDELKVAMSNSESQLVSAQQELNNYYIKSTSAGTVYQTLKEVGEAVRANEIIALIGQTRNRIIRLAVDQQDIDKIKNGQEILVRADVTGNVVSHAIVSRIYPVMNEVDQTFRVDAVFQDTVQQKYIHSSVEANILIQQKEKALIVPRTSMIADDSLQIKQDGKIKTIYVQTGIHTLDEVEILSGADEKTDIIVPSQK